MFDFIVTGLKHYTQNHFSDWILGIVIGAVGVAFAQYGLFALGMEEKMKPERRKHFHIVAFVMFFITALLVIGLHEHWDVQAQQWDTQTKTLVRVVDQMHKTQLDGSKKGGLKADVILATIISNIQIHETTNKLALGTVSSVSSVNSSAFNGNGINMIFVMRIVNAGVASSAWNWRAYMILPGGQKIDAGIPSIVGISAMPLSTVIGPVGLTMENNLLQNLSLAPLAAGSAVHGWLPFHVSGISEIPIGSRFVIMFNDVFGQETKIEHSWQPPFNKSDL